MTKDKLKSLFRFYLERLNRDHPTIEAKQLNPDTQMNEVSRGIHVENEIAHLKFVGVQALEFVDRNQVEKAMRWLGFLQGVLWARGVFTLNQLRDHARPDETD